MKKLLASLTILTILALPLGSAASAEQQTPPADLSVEEVHGNIPAQADAAQAMYPAVHSLVLAMTEMMSTTTAEKKKMVAMADHISARLEASADTSTSPWVTDRLFKLTVIGRLAR